MKDKVKEIANRYNDALDEVTTTEERQMWWASLSDEIKSVYGESSNILAVLKNVRIIPDHYYSEEKITSDLKGMLKTLISCSKESGVPPQK
jgi:hypothetical protein